MPMPGRMGVSLCAVAVCLVLCGTLRVAEAEEGGAHARERVLAPKSNFNPMRKFPTVGRATPTVNLSPAISPFRVIVPVKVPTPQPTKSGIFSCSGDNAKPRCKKVQFHSVDHAALCPPTGSCTADTDTPLVVPCGSTAKVFISGKNVVEYEMPEHKGCMDTGCTFVIGGGDPPPLEKFQSKVQICDSKANGRGTTCSTMTRITRSPTSSLSAVQSGQWRLSAQRTNTPGEKHLQVAYKDLGTAFIPKCHGGPPKCDCCVNPTPCECVFDKQGCSKVGAGSSPTYSCYMGLPVTVEPPAVDSASTSCPSFGCPTSGDGHTLTLAGRFFGKDPTVTVGGAKCVVKSSSDSALTCTIPEGQVGAEAAIVVLGGGSAQCPSPSDHVVRYSAPRVESVQLPPNGLSTGSALANRLTFTGSSFGKVAAQISVAFGSFACTGVKITTPHKAFECMLEPGCGENLALALEVNSVASPSKRIVSFPRPRASDVARPFPGTKGGALTVRGSHFGSGSPAQLNAGCAVSVSVGEAYGCKVDQKAVKDSELTCELQEGVGRGLAVRVEVAGLGGNGGASFSYPPPRIASAGPARNTEGGAVTVSGSNFGAWTEVVNASVGEFPCEIVAVDHDSLKCILGEGVGLGLPVLVFVAGQRSAHQAAFSGYSFQTPTISAVGASGEHPTSGGFEIKITGSNFGPERFLSTLRATMVHEFYKSRPCHPLRWVSHREVRCEAPEGVGTDHRVQVVFAQGGRQAKAESPASKSGKLAYDQPKTEFVSPLGDTRGGTTVRVEGRNFGNYSSQISVSVGESKCENVAVVNNSAITCTVGPGVGNRTVAVHVANQFENDPRISADYSRPVVSGVSPEASHAGAELRIFGDNFGAFSSEVRAFLGEEECEDLRLLEDHKAIGCVVPDGRRAQNLPVVVEVSGVRSEERENATFTFESSCEVNEYNSPDDEYVCLLCPEHTSSTPPGNKERASCECEKNFFGQIRNGPDAGGCFPCPAAGAQCGAQRLTVEAGWWTASIQDPPQKCYSEEVCKATTFRVEVSAAGELKGSRQAAGGGGGGANASRADTEQCTDTCHSNGESACSCGYTGVVCGECCAGYYRLQNTCAPCANSDNGVLTALMFVVLMVAFVILLFLLPLGAGHQFAVSKEEEAKGGYQEAGFSISSLVIVLYGMQFLGNLGNVNADWPDAVRDVFAALSLTSFNLELMGPECVSPTCGYACKTLGFLLLPLVVLATIWAVFALFWVPGKWATNSALARFGKRRKVRHRAVRATCIVLSLAFFVNAQWMLSGFNCVDIAGVQRLANHKEVVCWSDSSSSSRDYHPVGLLVTGIVVYVVGVYALLIFFLAFKARGNLRDRELRLSFGCLFQYSESAYWFEAVQSAVRFGLVATTALLPGVFSVLNCALILQLLYMVAVLVFRPFPRIEENVVAGAVGFAIVVHTYSGVLFSIRNGLSDDVRRVMEVVDLLVMAVALLAVLVRVALFLFQWKKRYVAARRQRAHQADRMVPFSSTGVVERVEFHAAVNSSYSSGIEMSLNPISPNGNVGTARIGADV